MDHFSFIASSAESPSEPTSPPAKEKLGDALKQMLASKDFNSITNAEIAKSAGVNEALIYRYFTNKRGLLHHVLQEYMIQFMNRVHSDLEEKAGALSKLRRLVQVHMQMYDSDRVFARILLLEVRNFPGYFESETYQLIKGYSRFLMRIIKEGMEQNEIRDDISSEQIRDLILGGIEHFCMAPVIFGHEIASESGAERLCDLIFNGIKKQG
jgi:AcrR family transcriptional regulator